MKVEVGWICQQEATISASKESRSSNSRRLEEMGYTKLRWEDKLKQDLNKLRLSEDMTSDGNAWRDGIKIYD